jgi:hypothetical protein
MSNNNFSRRRRGMRFRPKGGLGHNPQKPDRDATQARADVVAEQGGNERVFEKRHTHEIERAENIAAGLPPQKPRGKTAAPANIPEKRISASRISKRPRRCRRKNSSRWQFKEQPEGLVETIKSAATNLVKKVQRLIRPEKKPQGSRHQRRDARNARRRA